MQFYGRIAISQQIPGYTTQYSCYPLLMDLETLNLQALEFSFQHKAAGGKACTSILC